MPKNSRQVDCKSEDCDAQQVQITFTLVHEKKWVFLGGNGGGGGGGDKALMAWRRGGGGTFFCGFP